MWASVTKRNSPKTSPRPLLKSKVSLGIIGLLVLGLGALLYRQTHPELGTFTAPNPPETIIEKAPITLIEVHIAGAVHYPGVYQVAPGLRIREALAKAGGVLPNADLDSIKLSARLKDGQRIHVKPLLMPRKKRLE